MPRYENSWTSQSMLLGALLVSLTVGCSGLDKDVALRSRGLAHHSHPDVSPEFRAAKKLNSNLRLGYFTVPWIEDATADGEAPHAIRALKSQLVPDRWDEPGCTAFRRDGWLVVFHRDEVLQAIPEWVRLYQRQLEHSHGLANSEVAFLQARRDQIESVLGGPLAPGAHPITAAQVEELQELDDVMTISACRVITLGGQKGSVSVVEERAYLEDYEVTYVDDEQIVDPQIGVLQTGVWVEVTASRTETKGTLDVKLDVKTSELHKIDEVEVEFHGRTLALDLPEVSTRQISAHFVQPRGGHQLVVPEVGDPPLWVLFHCE